MLPLMLAQTIYKMYLNLMKIIYLSMKIKIYCYLVKKKT